MSIEQLVELIQNAKKMVADLAAKIKENTEGISNNNAVAESLRAREDKLKEDLEKLAADQASVASIISVDAQRIKNEEDARANEKAFHDRKTELSAQGKSLDDRRAALDREAQDLAMGREALRKDEEQLKKDRATYKEDVLKGMGIKV